MADNINKAASPSSVLNSLKIPKKIVMPVAAKTSSNSSSTITTPTRNTALLTTPLVSTW
ncbi:MAG: hypothetical protein EBR30_08035 [Cytophagia bacterium]|nr:hypothetical protein [Cytophagia bacterium]NBW34953.1 hypothetical protein [Cytophagia bacterium]